jgi:hypothetical protein
VDFATNSTFVVIRWPLTTLVNDRVAADSLTSNATTSAKPGEALMAL